LTHVRQHLWLWNGFIPHVKAGPVFKSHFLRLHEKFEPTGKVYA
jgi:hypothetical protein